MKLDFNLLECLEAVVTEGSFEKAAQRLAITQSAVSQRIRALEVQCGAPLLFRTRPVRPTPAAQPLLRFARQTRLLALEIWPEMLDAASSGQLRIAVNADSLGSWVLPALAPWIAEHETMLEFVVDDQEHTQTWLRNGEVLGSIGSAALAAAGFRTTPLGLMRYRCVAAPQFVQRYLPQGLDRAAVRGAPALVFNRRDALHAEHLRRHLHGKATLFPHHFVPGYEAFLQAALLGYGYGLLPQAQCAEALARGTLIDITPQTPASVPLYWQTWGIASPLIATLTRALVAGAASVLEALPPADEPVARRRGRAV